MFLHRLRLDRRCREARRDLADPYQMHSTLCRAFSPPEAPCSPGSFLWRLEISTNSDVNPCLLVQSEAMPDWRRIGIRGWLVEEPHAAIDLDAKLSLNLLQSGRHYRFRLRANPCITRAGKRQGLFNRSDQEAWLERIGKEQAGFALPRLSDFAFAASGDAAFDIAISQESLLRGKNHEGIVLTVFSVLYDGILRVTEPDKFKGALHSGIGHGKALGLGLLSVVPAS